MGAIEGAFGPQAWALAAMKKGGIEAIAKQFADAKSISGAIGKGVAKGAAVEGAEELVQNPIEQVAGYQDPTTRQAIGETLFGGAMGAIGGGVLGGGMAGVAYRQPDAAPTPPRLPILSQTRSAPSPIRRQGLSPRRRLRGCSLALCSRRQTNRPPSLCKRRVRTKRRRMEKRIRLMRERKAHPWRRILVREKRQYRRLPLRLLLASLGTPIRPK